MVSDDQYHRLKVKACQPKSIIQFFRQSPLAGVKLDWERDKDTGRKVALRTASYERIFCSIPTVGHRRITRGDRASPQSDGGLAQRQRF